MIAYGNPLRCDDGIAWQAAEELRRSLPASAQVICVHQLTPELAENVSRVHLVIFLDAAMSGQAGSIVCESLTAEETELRFSHHLTPQEVLALSERLYEAHACGFLVSIHGRRFEHGDAISREVVQAIPKVVAQVTELLSDLLDVSMASNQFVRVSPVSAATVVNNHD